MPGLHDRTPDCHPVYWAWIEAYFLTCYPRVFVQPGIGRRPVVWCWNQMSVQYIQLDIAFGVSPFRVLGTRCFVLRGPSAIYLNLTLWQKDDSLTLRLFYSDILDNSLQLSNDQR